MSGRVLRWIGTDTALRRSKRLVALFTAGFVCAAFSRSPANAYDACDNVVEKGEGIGGPLFGLEYALVFFAVAEKYCGAKPASMTSAFLPIVAKEGCGPGTPIYAEIAEGLPKLEAADLKMLAGGADPAVQLSQAEAEDWARREVLPLFKGGCAGMVEWHDQWPKFGDPGPAPPGSRDINR